MLSPPCISAGPRIPCDICIRHIRCQTCFDNPKKKTEGKSKNSACELLKYCGTCRTLITFRMNERKKRFCVTCNENKAVDHLCFMRPLVNMPASSEHVLYVFYDFETMQDTTRSDKSNVPVPNLVCIQQFCSKC